MGKQAFLLLFLLGSYFTTSFAQSNSSAPQTAVQKLGQRVFEQRCPVCHTQPALNSRRYGPALSKGLVESNEDMIRQVIVDGVPGRMPGFKYGLTASEIDAIIAYLKTVPAPASIGVKNSSTN